MMSWSPNAPPPGQPQPPYPGHSPMPPYPQTSPYPPHHAPYQYPPSMQSQYPQYPQQGYGQPPPFPPAGHSPIPPSHSPYGPPQHQGYGAPPQGYPPQQQPQPPFGAPPGQYGAPGPYDAPPHQPPFGQQQQYGAPPGQQYGGPPSQPSLGYIPGQVAPVDMSREADQLRSAMKGFGTDERALIAVLPRLDPLQINGVKQAFQSRHRRNLTQDLEKETSGYFRDGLVALARGPLEQDCHNLDKALNRPGTKESMLNDVLLSRSNADINAIKAHYHHVHKRSLESDVRGDLSMKTERLFSMVLAARRNEESAPVIPQQIDADVQELYRATEGQRTGKDAVPVCSIFSSRSDGQLRAISHAYQQKYHRALQEVIKSNFSGHMEDALVFMLSAAEDRAKHDASLLEDAMKGMGTKDDLLVNRVVRVHWDRQRLHQAKAAYRHFYKRELADRIRGETKGDYERLMVACVESA